MGKYRRLKAQPAGYMGLYSGQRIRESDEEAAGRLIDKPWGKWTKADVKTCERLLKKERAAHQGAGE